jgi:hypothetical protein
MKLINSPISTVAFSDTHIWTSFPQNDKLVTNIDVETKFLTFDSLKNIFKKNKNYTEEKYV